MVMAAIFLHLNNVVGIVIGEYTTPRDPVGPDPGFTMAL